LTGVTGSSEEEPMKVMVYAVDSEDGEAAVKAAVGEAIRRGAALALVAYIRLDTMTSDIRKYVEAEQRRLDDLAEEARRRGVSEVGTHVIRSSAAPGEEVASLAQSENVDLLVIGVRRRTKVGKMLLGSTAQEILLRADCPVLAVKTDR
jgi:nucleotide-binding universal stress UspA family protein